MAKIGSLRISTGEELFIISLCWRRVLLFEMAQDQVKTDPEVACINAVKERLASLADLSVENPDSYTPEQLKGSLMH